MNTLRTICSDVDVNEYRAMIAVFNIRQDLCISQIFFQWLSYVDIINSPAFIL